VVAALVMTCAASTAFCQTGNAPSTESPPVKGPAPALEFEVASIRENKSIGGRNHIMSSSHDAHFTTINAPLMMILQYAFDIPQTRILDAPGWLNSEKFDIEAKADTLDDQLSKLPSDEAKAQKRKMIQALLAERFALKLHPETRELPIYALVVAKGGPKLQDSKSNGCMINGWRAEISIQGCASMTVLGEELAENLGRVVIDKTGLDGRYDIDLKWTPADSATSSSDSGPSIFTALQEQLGLKLESQKGPVQVLVIDHVEQPSAN
jgi:uncharacterized protein (TIGR03435 family)